MGDINTGLTGKTSRQSSRVEDTKEESFAKTKMHADEQDDRKPSILSRIKKSH